MSGRAFWSYVRDDDKADKGRISQLAHDVVDEYKFLTGEEIELFLDTDDLRWGDDWRKEIDARLDSEFFIAVVTPRYLKSVECRRELQSFLQLATELGRIELLLPLYYVDVQTLNSKEASEDDLANKLRDVHRFDWRSNRLKDPSSEEYRKGVNEITCELIERNKKLEERSVVNISKVRDDPDEREEEEPGIIDRLAKAEDATFGFTEILEGITADFDQITSVMHEATVKIEAIPEGRKQMAQRLLVAHELSAKLAEPTDRICESASVVETRLHDIDDGIRVLEGITADFDQITSVMHEATVKIEAIPEGRKQMAQRLLVAHELSAKLAEPTDRICESASVVETRLHDIDDGIRVIVELAPDQVRDDPEARKRLCELFSSIKVMAESAKDAATTTGEMRDTVGQLEPISRVTRPVLRRLRTGLTIMANTFELPKQWVNLIDESEIECL